MTPIANVIDLAFQIFYYALLIRIILSFFATTSHSRHFLYQLRMIVFKVTEPVLAPFRNLIPPIQVGAGYLDLSPLIALVLLNIVRNLILSLL